MCKNVCKFITITKYSLYYFVVIFQAEMLQLFQEVFFSRTLGKEN